MSNLKRFDLLNVHNLGLPDIMVYYDIKFWKLNSQWVSPQKLHEIPSDLIQIFNPLHHVLISNPYISSLFYVVYKYLSLCHTCLKIHRRVEKN
jgi:hypothetical protein